MGNETSVIDKDLARFRPGEIVSSGSGVGDKAVVSAAEGVKNFIVGADKGPPFVSFFR